MSGRKLASNAKEIARASRPPQRAPRPRRQADIAGFRRKALIEAALAEITRHGIAGSTLERIAAGAGVTHGLIRHYFRGKSDLLVQAFQSLVDEFREEWARERARGADEPLVRLAGLVTVNFRAPVFQRERLAAWAAFWDAARTDAAIRAVNRAFYAAYRREVAEHLAAVRGGTPEDAAAAASGTIAVLDGLWLELTVDPEAFSVETARDICADYVEHLLAGTSGGERFRPLVRGASAPQPPPSAGQQT